MASSDEDNSKDSQNDSIGKITGPDRKRPSPRARWVAIAAIAAAFLHNAILSWGKWGDLIIDCGMDLEDARMLLEPGHTLYVNPLYPYGPLIPHFNALLFKLFGVHLNVFIVAGLCAAALMTIVIYRTARLFIGRLGSAAAAIAFLYCCAFAQLTPNGSFNFIFSYRSCAQYGALLAMSSVYFLIRHARLEVKREKEKGKSSGVARTLDFLISVLLLALAGLTKLEVLTAAALAHFVFIVSMVSSRTFSWKLHLPGYAAAAALFAGAYGYFYAIAGQSLFVDNIFQMAIHPNYLLYARRLMGTDNLGGALLEMVQSLGFFAAAFIAPVAIAHAIHARKDPAPILSRMPLLAIGCAACAFGLYSFQSLETAFRFVPVLSFGILAGVAVVLLKYKERRVHALPIILYAFAVGSLGRMFFRTISYHYGFYLLPPGLLAVAVFGFDTLPSLWRAQPQFKKLCAAATTGVFAALVISHLRISTHLYTQRTYPIETPRGKMIITPTEIIAKSWFMEMQPGEREVIYPLPTAEYWNDIIQFLSKLPRDSRVLIVPHGSSSLTFFSGLDNPYKDYVTAAPTLKGRFDDEEFLEKVKREPPNYIIKSKMSVAEYGQAGFGKSYAVKTWEWLEPRYELDKEYPQPVKGASLKYIVRLKRK